MKNSVKLKGKQKMFFRYSLYLGFLLLGVNVAVYFINIQAAILVSLFALLYFTIVLCMIHSSKRMIMNDFIGFATEYGQMQKKMLRELEMPYALLDDTGKVIWTNKEFERVTGREHGFNRSVTSIFPSLTRDRLPVEKGVTETELDFEFEESNFHAKMKKLSLSGMARNSELVDVEDYSGFIVGLYLFDVTALKIALREVDDQSVTVGMVYLDNYEEALESVEEVRRSLLIALIDRKINKYIASFDGICKKLEKDKYLVILRKKAIAGLQEAKFDILEDVKTVNIGNEMAVTISMGIGVGGLTYAQNYEFARNAIDLALGRGGDQAVIKSADNIIYYGGKSQQVEKSTRVKARVKAHALREIITAKDQVFIMGHRLGDVDSFGASIGIYRIAKMLDRKAHIVLNDVSTSLQPLVDMFIDNPNYESDMIINSQQAIDMVGSNSVLVIVDVNRPSITECPELLHFCKSVVVLDHHRQGSEVVENATLSYVEAYASSACEMVAEILQYTLDNIRICSEEADCLYSGIMIDTNNFMTKTGVRTFEAAAFLRRNGADVTRVRKLFREGAAEYKAKADAVSQAEIYRTFYAISICTSEEVASPTVVGAQAANELLNIKGIRASFILTDYQGKIFVSARSIDDVNVQVIMERLGGGGHMNIAGCQMEGTSIYEAIGAVKRTIDSMIESGELD